uniref:Putative domain HDIG-containing protein n=1 Tax=Desulfovibrio sp. U5L TaxID=596152 RepID=I2PYH0_9BACT
MKKRLPLAALSAGLTLAEPLCRADGVLLLPRGALLTERHLALFPVWGIEAAAVVLGDAAATEAGAGSDGCDAPDEAAALEAFQADPETLAAVDALLRPRFVHAALSEAVMSRLYALRLSRAARQLARRGPAALAPPGPVPPESLPPLPDGPPPGPMTIIESDPKLTSLPDVFVRINEVLNDAHSTAKEAAEVIGMDTSLSAKLLTVVNSAFYGFPVKVDTLSRAVTIVGSRQLTTLALGISVISIFKDLPGCLVDMRSFWKHSISCGVVASALAGPDTEVDVERLFVAGLLHDVGRLVLYRGLPRHAAHTLALARAEGILLRDAERRTLGFDHATLAGMLLRKWRFPESLEKAVRHHHGGPTHMGLVLPAIVHTADVVTAALDLGSSGEAYVPPLSPVAWTTVGLAPERIADVVAAADVQIEDIIKAFLPGDV